MLQGATKLSKSEMKLSKSEMKSVKGGVPAAEYCATLREIATNNMLTHEACQGANYGAERAGCGFRFICD